jgi:polysaccharide biosynthesis protein PslF
VSVAYLPAQPYNGSEGRARTFGMLSSFPPTQCGLATFTAALSTALSDNGAEVSVVRVVDAAGPRPISDRVVGEIVNGSPASLVAGTDLLNQCDVAVVQHEYGLFGGTDGDEVLDVLGRLDIPAIVIAHTVLNHPTPHQRSVLNDVAAVADQVVVMSEAAQLRLCDRFDIDPTKVVTIPHGAAIPPRRVPLRRSGRPLLLTWGLIGPGKGIERAIDAMGGLHDLPMRPRYLVAGQTHPKVRAAHGETYRQARMEQARLLGVDSSVFFDAEYRDVASLTGLIQSSAVVVLPYDSTEQVTSGVLVDAIAAGRPVVSTAFPHATELLASGAGLVVEHDDPEAMAHALRRVLTEPGLARRMEAEAHRLAPSLGWSVVADQYRCLADELVSESSAMV